MLKIALVSHRIVGICISPEAHMCHIISFYTGTRVIQSRSQQKILPYPGIFRG